MEDVLLFMQPWGFNISTLPAALAPAVAVVHATDDNTVPAVFAHSVRRR